MGIITFFKGKDSNFWGNSYVHLSYLIYFQQQKVSKSDLANKVCYVNLITKFVL